MTDALPVTLAGVGFNNEVRKALDPDSALHLRFGALRSAVQRFSPNGFDATFRNLEVAVGVCDPDSWTDDEIARSAVLLRASRARYLDHRAMWDEHRRIRKAQGLREPSLEEQDAFGDRSWSDHVSLSSDPKACWVGLAEWVRVNNLAPAPVGHDLEDDLQTVLDRIPPARLDPKGSMLAHYGPFPLLHEPGNVIAIPDRIYNDPIADPEYRDLSDQQRLLADCWYSRSGDGYVRQHHLRRVVHSEEYWAVPYVVAALADYVVEIVHDVEIGLRRVSDSGSWHRGAYRHFAANNSDFMALVRQRAISYRNCYYRGSYSGTGTEAQRPVYPAFSVLDRLEDPATYNSRLYLVRAGLPPTTPSTDS